MLSSVSTSFAGPDMETQRLGWCERTPDECCGVRGCCFKKKENSGQVLLVLYEVWANEFLVRGRLWKLVLDLQQARMLASPAHPNVARKLLATFE